jgi:hypothetical protein
MIVACARKRSRIAVAAGTSPRKTPQSWVGRFVVMSVDAVSCRRTQTSKRSSAAFDPSFFIPKSSRTSKSTRVSCGTKSRRAPVASASAKSAARVEGAADEGAVAGPNGADGDRGNEARAGQFDDLGLRDLGIEAPVEIGKRLHDGNARLFEPPCEERFRASRTDGKRSSTSGASSSSAGASTHAAQRCNGPRKSGRYSRKAVSDG